MKKTHHENMTKIKKERNKIKKDYFPRDLKALNLAWSLLI